MNPKYAEKKQENMIVKMKIQHHLLVFESGLWHKYFPNKIIIYDKDKEKDRDTSCTNEYLNP